VQSKRKKHLTSSIQGAGVLLYYCLSSLSPIHNVLCPRPPTASPSGEQPGSEPELHTRARLACCLNPPAIPLCSPRPGLGRASARLSLSFSLSPNTKKVPFPPEGAPATQSAGFPPVPRLLSARGGLFIPFLDPIPPQRGGGAKNDYRDVDVRRQFLGFCLRVNLLTLLLDGPYGEENKETK